MAQRGREELVRAIGEDVQRIGLASERIGHLFAESQRLHSTDFRALTAIYRAEREGCPLTGKALADSLQLSPAAITYVVDRLVASGHVRRQRDGADRRRIILRYAESGLTVAGAFFGPLGVAHGKALAEFGDDELRVARRALDAIVATLERYGDGLASGGPPE